MNCEAYSSIWCPEVIKMLIVVRSEQAAGLALIKSTNSHSTNILSHGATSRETLIPTNNNPVDIPSDFKSFDLSWNIYFLSIDLNLCGA